jgi:ribosomal protein L11 methyltransferase
MDTLLSFGTGLHETTQIVSQYIEDCSGQFKSFMDIGTGTGILSMVALKSGATQVLAIDIGDLSIEAAKCNFKANRLNAVVKQADITRFRNGQTYDFVAANLITQDLIDHHRQIISFVKPGGYLAVSGISLDNLVKLQSVFRKLPLRCLKTQKGKQWSGLLYQKKMS